MFWGRTFDIAFHKILNAVSAVLFGHYFPVMLFDIVFVS